MPGVLIGFWLLIGLGTGLVLNDPEAPIYGKVDRHAHSSGRLDTVPFYELQSSVPWMAVATPDVYGNEACRVTVIAFHTRRTNTRLVLDGVEQELGNGWRLARTVNAGERHEFVAEFLNPVGGKLLARRTTEVKCVLTPTASTRNNVLYDERGLKGYEKADCPCANQ